MGEIRCAICGKALSGELDTYGEVGLPMCWDCWSLIESLCDDDEELPDEQATPAR